MSSETATDYNAQIDTDTVTYRENFIPYAVEHDDGSSTMYWAIFDAKSSPERDGTSLFSRNIVNEINSTGRPISKAQVTKFAIANDAHIKFGSEKDPLKAVDLLQKHLGPKIDAKDFLARYGFDSGDLLGFTFQQKQTEYDHKFTPSTKHSVEITKEVTDDRTGHVPLEKQEFEKWSDTKAQNLLYSALIHRYNQIDDNLKGTVKECISAAFALHKTATWVLTDPGHSGMQSSLYISSALCSLVSMGVMTRTAYTAQSEFNEIFKTYCEYRNNMNNKSVHSRESAQKLKKAMYQGGITYEGIPLVDSGIFRSEYKDFFNALGEAKGLIHKHHSPIPNNNVQVSKLITDLKNRTPLCVKTSLRVTKKTANIIGQSLKEIGTDLNILNAETRKKTFIAIGAAFKTLGKDFYQSTRSAFKTTEQTQDKYHAYKSEALQLHQAFPEIVEQQISLDEIEAHAQAAEEIKTARSNKTVNGVNFGLASGANSTQIGEMGFHISNSDWVSAAECFYGVVTGYGAWGQTGVNLTNDDQHLHGKRSQEVQSRPDIDEETISRIHKNIERKNKEAAKESAQEEHLHLDL